MIMNDMYRRQVALLIRVMPLVFKIKDFAVHGGTAINLFHRNLPRYSVDIDVTYIPMEDRNTSLAKINSHLSALKKAPPASSDAREGSKDTYPYNADIPNFFRTCL